MSFFIIVPSSGTNGINAPPDSGVAAPSESLISTTVKRSDSEDKVSFHWSPITVKLFFDNVKLYLLLVL